MGSTLNTIWRAIWSTLNTIWRAIWSTLNTIWRASTLQSRLRAFLRLDSMEDADACFSIEVVYTYSDTAFSMTSFDQRLSLKRYPFIATAFIFGPISMGIVSYSAAIPLLCRTRYF